MTVLKTVQEQSSLWNYEVVQAFNELNYQGLLTKKDLMGGKELVIKECVEFITENSKDGTPIVTEKIVELNNYYFILQKNTDRFLLRSDFVSKLPIQVKSFKKVAWNKEGFKLITNLSSVGFKPEKVFSFRDVVDNFAYFKHSNSNHFKLWKIISFSAYLSRINIRVASLPSFGKDSIMRLLDDLMENIGIVQKPTLAKLEHLTNNKVILVNEFVNLGKTESRDIEQYLLPIGDFSNKYQKRSRSSSTYGGSEEYDTSKLSIMLTFNNKNCYPEDTIYFDEAHSQQVKERFLPFKFDGILEQGFMRELNPKTIAESNRQFYIDMGRSISYYKDPSNVDRECKDFKALGVESDLRNRWKISFETISRFVNLYANDEKEYHNIMKLLFNCHIDYLEMVSKGNKTLKSEFFTKFDDGEDFSKTITESVE